jgi:putative DNA primase/helicase
MTAITHLDGSAVTPSWLGDRQLDGPVVSCANGILHVSSRKLHKHTPAYLNLVSVPFGYNSAAAPPLQWLAFLARLWPGDAHAVAALQDWFGYVLSGRMDLQKILLLIGPPRSGKGTIARVLQAMIGRANCASPTLAGLAGEFGLQPLLGKPLAVVAGRPSAQQELRPRGRR